MSEIKKDAKLIPWQIGADRNKDKSSFNDFSTESDYAKLDKGVKITLKNPSWRNSNGNEFPVFEAYQGTKFVGYVSFRRLQGQKFEDILHSERTGRNYSKFTPQNAYAKKEKITFGHETLSKVLDGKTLECLDVVPQEVPKFLGKGVEPDKEQMVKDTYYLFNIVK